MTSVYLVRHGQTAWNKEEVFRGRTDIPLNETGLREASLAGEYFRPIELHAIYSSPLSRAWQTAQRIAEHHSLEIQPLDGLIDMSFGSWEGHSLKEVEERDGECYRLWKEEPHRLKLPGGESLEEVRGRALAALEGVIRKYPDKTAVLVSHRVINKVLLCGILGLDNSHFWQIKQDTTAINLIEHRKGNYILSLMNETCHLKALQGERTKKDF
ncbi:MAG: histidine phosphatase family protein [Deltaproteobacteria bacterium]|nr:MAG: histidine phosphatase family protein [Deltaproteobacteria bacterium]